MDVRITPGEVRTKRYPWEAASWVEAAVDQPGQIDVALDELGIDRSRVTADLQGLLGESCALQTG